MKCARCGKRPRRSYHAWCQPCANAYQNARAASRPDHPCACGCGGAAKGDFIPGHNTRMLPAEEQSRRGRMNDGAKQRDRGAGKSYRKVGGRHEHRTVAEKQLGRKLRKGEIVHHKNGDKRDNRPSNLVVITQAEHARLHFKAYWADRRKS